MSDTETTTDTPAEQEEQYKPVFWRADYARFASAVNSAGMARHLRRARHTMGTGGYNPVPKDPQAQEVIDTLSELVADALEPLYAHIAAIFAADSDAAGRVEGDKHYFDPARFSFDREKFLADTQLKTSGAEGQDDEDDEDDIL